nr:peroxisomal (S)-2-hydroxy-acid oxidase GLO3-like isoform X1 [Rhipicephalus microplus]
MSASVKAFHYGDITSARETVAGCQDTVTAATMAVETVGDIEKLAEGKMEESARLYIALGAGREQTLRENTLAFQRILLRPRIFVDVERINTSTTLLGQAVSFPVGLAPSAVHKIAHPEGEISTAKAAKDAGTLMILSSLSTFSLEDVRAAAPGCLLWQQTYIFRDRTITKSLVERAASMGFSAIVVTADSPVLGDTVRRHAYRTILPRGLSFANTEGACSKGFDGCEPKSKYSSDMESRPSATWEDIEWLRRLSGLPVVVKGVLTAQAALAAHQHGAAAVIVSNHGGRQLDGTPATIDVLPEIVAAVGDKMEVYLDSGVRTGADVVKALALGARAVFVGRPVLWGLAHDGKQGVDRMLQILREELERTMQLLGCADIKELCEDFVLTKSHCLTHSCSPPQF